MSEGKKGEARRGANEGQSPDRASQKETRPSDKGKRKQRAGDLGRALRSIYDDTLRESVPDDLSKLLGKLN